jgi:uncharacterized protein YjdB
VTGGPALVTRLDVTPPSATLALNETMQFTAQPFDSSGTQAIATVTWATDNPTVATVSDAGAVTARSVGGARITASAGGIDRAVSITVNEPPAPPVITGGGGPPPVVSIRISGARDQVEVGTTFQLGASPLGASGSTLQGRTVTWTSDNPSVAIVDGVGQVTAVAQGNANITATSEQQSTFVPLRVLPEAVARVSMSPDQVNPLAIGETVTLRAAAYSSRNGALQAREEQWQSSNPSVATVQNGVVQARAPGQADISVSIEGHNASVPITVEAAAPVLPTISPREAVTATVKSYEQALQLKDFDAIREVFPSMSSAQQRQLRDFVDPLEGLTVRIDIDQINLAGDQANVEATQQYQFTDAGRSQTFDGQLTLVLRLGSDGTWRITETR